MNSKVFILAQIPWADNPDLPGGSVGEFGDWWTEIQPHGEVFLLEMKRFMDGGVRETHFLPTFSRAKEKAQEIIAEWLSPYLAEGGSE
jgi:hypothetical protein